MSNVVLISPGGSILRNFDTHRKVLLLLDPEPGCVAVITWSNAPVPVGVTLIALSPDTASTPGRRLGTLLGRILSGSVIGRNLLRITPWDGGRLLWRAARRHPEAMAALTGSDVIVAIERDAIITAWNALRRSRQSDPYAAFGIAAGIAHLSQIRK